MEEIKRVHLAMAKRQADHDQPAAMSAFAARRAKRPRPTQNPFADITNGWDSSRGSQTHQARKENGDKLSPPKKQRTKPKPEILKGPVSQPSAVVKLPSTPQDESVTDFSGNVEPLPVVPNSADSELGMLGDHVEDNVASDVQLEENGSEYGSDHEE